MYYKLLKDYSNSSVKEISESFLLEFRKKIEIMIAECKSGTRFKEELLQDLDEEIMAIQKHIFEFKKFIYNDNKKKPNKSDKSVDSLLAKYSNNNKRMDYPELMNILNDYLNNVIGYYKEIKKENAQSQRQPKVDPVLLNVLMIARDKKGYLCDDLVKLQRGISLTKFITFLRKEYKGIITPEFINNQFLKSNEGKYDLKYIKNILSDINSTIKGK